MNLGADRLADSQLHGSEIGSACTARGLACFSRRHLLVSLAAAAPVLCAGPAIAANWLNIDVSGDVPSVAFTMTAANTGKRVAAVDFEFQHGGGRPAVLVPGAGSAL
jgi:hypothetical protein